MLSDRCPVLSVCLYSLSVTLVYCDQTVGRMKMKLGKPIGLGTGHIVSDGHPVPLAQRARAPIFGPYLLWPNGWMDQGATWYEGRPPLKRHCVRWEPSSPSPKRGQSPQFSAHVYCGQTVAHPSYCYALIDIGYLTMTIMSDFYRQLLRYVCCN